MKEKVLSKKQIYIEMVTYWWVNLSEVLNNEYYHKSDHNSLPLNVLLESSPESTIENDGCNGLLAISDGIEKNGEYKACASSADISIGICAGEARFGKDGEGIIKWGDVVNSVVGESAEDVLPPTSVSIGASL